MAEHELEENCPDCGTNLIRITEDDELNHRDGDAITCPACLNTIRVE